MEEDGNGTARPPFVGIETHADHVAEDHGGKIQGPEDEETYPQTTLRDNEVPAAAREVEANLAVKENNESLRDEERTVGNEPRVPFLHRRQKGHRD